ncbi:PEGA domain-containing protein, partial [bacterium]|nr:PEGA domain-containing protein [bacterium]
METRKIISNRYEILSVLNQGHSGAIYKAHDHVLSKSVAIKEIDQELLADSSFLELVQLQIRHSAKMNHQNIVHVFDSVRDDDGSLYIVMELVDGIDLMTVLQEFHMRGQTIPQALGIHIISEVCKALDYAHNCSDSTSNDPLNLIHKCVSPGNIILTRTGVVKLNDFGIDGIQAETNINQPWRVQYMSPEHVSYGTTLDKRSDLFSLGLILYEILEGRRFFSSEDPQEIVAILRNGRLKLKDTRHIPKALQTILNKALDKSLDGRYQNANQFYIDLVTYLVLNNDAAALDLDVSKFVEEFAGADTTTPAIKTPHIGYDEEQAEVAKTEEIPVDSTEISSPKTEPLTPPDLDSEESADELIPSINLLPDQEKSQELAEEGDDDVKTVIDLVRLSTRGHKKQVMKGLFSVATFSVLFLLLDFSFQWTPVGAKAYDMVFPPAIKVASVPTGAKAYLNGEALPGTTPLSIDKIAPGVYELKLETDNYEPIVKSIHVLSKGQIQVAGSVDAAENPSYLFRFKTTLEIDSSPQGAEVYLNDILYSQTTPCQILWEVGESIEIELRKDGFEHLTGFSLHSEEMLERIDDKRFWDYAVRKDPNRKLQIKGKFGKLFTFDSKPAGAEVYLDGNQDPVGTTGSGQSIFLTAASHRIEIKKSGYNNAVYNITVDENSKSDMFTMLTRPVRFLAYDATNGTRKDLGAVMTKLVLDGKSIARNRKTPSKMNLEDRTYNAYFTKEGFGDLKVTVSAKDSVVLALMQPLATHLYVVIIEQETGMPISNAEVRYRRIDQAGTREGVFNVTDAEGTCHGSLTPGKYTFSIVKDQFSFQEKSIEIRSSEVNLVEFTLTKTK